MKALGFERQYTALALVSYITFGLIRDIFIEHFLFNTLFFSDPGTYVTHDVHTTALLKTCKHTLCKIERVTI